ncbi:MAG: HAMP domain-containing histidine kinase, partial [Actinomycetota bacterium]|nr:HAMP domain-containing histidine kinase [Actinomycetota bacterium]
MIGFALSVGVSTLAVGLIAAAALRRLPTLRWQLVGLAVVAVTLPLAAVVLSGVVMFDSAHDLIVLAVAAASSTASLVAALLLARAAARPLERLRETASAIARGDLERRAAVTGPAEARELALAFNDMARALEALFDARRELVAWASHDLRTPLASLQAMLEAVEDGLAEPERYVPSMREQVRLLSGLVDDLFELARIDSGALTLEICTTPADRLVASCLRGVEAEADARRIRLEARVGEPVPSIRCAPEKVERVLYNLLTNALRHTPSDGAVAVRVEPLPEEVRITVEDTGEGFSPESLRRAFAPGRPAKTARTCDRPPRARSPA